MKIKDLQGFPEKRGKSEFDRGLAKLDDPLCDLFPNGHHRYLRGYNEALSELGELEVVVDREALKEIMEESADYVYPDENSHKAVFKDGIPVWHTDKVVEAIATAIEQGEIVKLKENDNG